jgi:hypothetical protein
VPMIGRWKIRTWTSQSGGPHIYFHLVDYGWLFNPRWEMRMEASPPGSPCHSPKLHNHIAEFKHEDANE